MPSWPPDWKLNTLGAAGVPATHQSLKVLSAWCRSTPLPPLSNNPLGMPAGSSGAPSYLSTRYAIFPSMAAFYKAFGAFARTSAGHVLAVALDDKGGYPVAWRAISALPWPAKDTETDYPAILLDLCSQSYRDSVDAVRAASRKTSGIAGTTDPNKPSVLQAMRDLHARVASADSAAKAARNIYGKGT